VTPRKGGLVRIAIGSRYLDRVQIRLDLPDSLSHLSFPANRHRGRVEEDRVSVFTQGPTAVKLFADGVLPPVGRGAVTVAIDCREFGPCQLEAVEICETRSFELGIVLRFRRVMAAGGDE
jgi:hypothetical protein